jgi:hypothetical protein
VEIHFGKSDKGEIKVNDSVRKGLGNDAFIIVSDIKAMHQELVEIGANVIEGPVERIYGSIEVVIRDCNSFMIVFSN